MKWLVCFAKTPAVGEREVAVKAQPREGPEKHRGEQPKLEKQDSAFLDREALGAASPEAADTYDNPISTEYATSESLNGNAAAFKTFGPPKPICNEARLANIKELGVMDRAPGDPQIQHIMQLMCSVFNTESALVALVGDDNIYVHDAINFKKGDFAWRQSFCAHTLTPANHQVMVVENATKDARFKHLPLVTARKVGFYAGTPIVSSKGHRLGTVCFASSQPRAFDAEGCNMLTNMGELVTRELEREWASQLQSQAITSKAQDAASLLRAIDCFNDAVIFIDVSKPKWQILHLNSAALTKLKLFGVVLEANAETALWDLFEPNTQASTSWESCSADIKAGRKFEVSSVRFSRRGSHNSAHSPTFGMTFRCAANDVIDSNAQLVGSPAYMPMTESNRQYYFVTLSQVHGSHSTRSSTNSQRSFITGSIDPESVPFDGLELGPLLGKGGYGRVYRGVREGQTLAVKIIDNTASLTMVDGQPLESVITKEAVHPNVLRTLDYAVTSADADSGSDSGDERFDSANSRHKHRYEKQTWMLLEYCDSGCLQEASDRGYFLKEGKPNLAAILSVAKEVASGMAFLHERGVAHGDLTGGNVLLASDATRIAGVTAKIADFGLARTLDVQSKIETRTYGTVTHMPPELLLKGVFSKAADVFSLGVLLWEMYHGVRAWSSMNHAQIITAVAVNRRSLQFSPGTPEGYKRIALDLMAHDPDNRPTMAQAVAAFEDLQASLA